jgi:hypothetical protein
MSFIRTFALFVVTALFHPIVAPADEPDWQPLFNGKDLSNWVNVNCAPDTWAVGDGVIRCTGKPTGALRTKVMYENFVVELEWRHLKEGGNAGIFVWSSPIAAPGVPFLRSVEVQVLDNGYNAKGKNEWYTTHGDVFPIHGSTMKPIHKGNGMRCFPLAEHSHSAPEWNAYRIEARDGTIRLSVNGHLVTGGDDCVWRKGYFGLESEGSPTEWRNLRIQVLPGSSATAEQTAPEAAAWTPLYTGVDLAGWTTGDDHRKAWTSQDWQLRVAKDGDTLWSDLSHKDFELVVDLLRDGEGGDEKSWPHVVLQRGDKTVECGAPDKPRAWQRQVISLTHGKVKTTSPSSTQTAELDLPEDGDAPVRIGLRGDNAAFANLYLRELKN